MRFVGNSIDAAGNLIVTRNPQAIYMEGVQGLSLSNFHFVGVQNTTFIHKVRIVWQVVRFVFGRQERVKAG